ncbi:MAG TPA: PHP-associated domain-containing protein [Solirubrobacteraceae bacterium]|nr:PHP-associated domain-containing protein [Solirubrobacteraceae bacterium]
MAASPLSIAHVTPYPWEASENDVNAFVRATTAELARRGHRVLVLAPSRSQERVRATRRVLRAARAQPQELLERAAGGEPEVLAVGEVLDVQVPARFAADSSTTRGGRSLPIDVARTIEELLGMVELDVVHVHEPFAPSTANAALRHSRALNVGTFHAPTERVLSTLLGRRFVATFFGRLDVRTASFPATAELMRRHFPADYRLVAPADGEGAGGSDETHGGAGGGDGRHGGAGGGGEERHGGGRTWGEVADDLERVYRELAARRRDPGGDPELSRRLAGRGVIEVDLHMHTDHSHDCATPVEVLLASAREQGLGAIAVTDHNEISGALAARELARAEGSDAGASPGPALKVIVGEEVKTASQGEVIGLFLEERIPRGLSLAETIGEIRGQGGVVYVPHPFDRMHAVPDYEHLLPVLEEVDAIEVFNPRVAIGAFNEEAARFAAKYRIPAGAGSDAHVAQGLGSVRVRMPDFEGPAEFLQALRESEIVTSPKSLLYVQALKFLQTRATPPAARRARRERRVRRATGRN